MMAVPRETVSTCGAGTARVEDVDAAMGAKVRGGVVEIQGTFATGAHALA